MGRLDESPVRAISLMIYGKYNTGTVILANGDDDLIYKKLLFLRSLQY